MSDARTIVVEGGNQSGKSYLATSTLASYLMNKHPLHRWPPDDPPTAWYCTTTFDLFAEQPWVHIKNFLLYPGESELTLPTRNIQYIAWHRPGVPKLIVGTTGWRLVPKSYESGRSEFQAKTLPFYIVDEECPDDIWGELRARRLAAQNSIGLVAATPIKGMAWLEKLRTMAVEGRGGVAHYRLNTMDNPGMSKEAVEDLQEELRDRPEELDLRLKGVPYFAQGLVYPDGLFRAEHVIDPFNIPRDWARYRCVDHGYRNCACVWMAINPMGDTVVVYKDYLGKERTIRQNCEIITADEKDGHLFAGSWIDPATRGTEAESGKRVIDMWREYGYDCDPAPDNRVLAGVERCKQLMVERGGDGTRPRLRIFNTCRDWLQERKNYKWNAERPKGDEKKDKPEKRDDHIMDAFRYIVAAGIEYVEPPRASAIPDPIANPVGYAFWKKRHRQRDNRPKL